MTGRDLRILSWHKFPMVDEDCARRLLDRKDDLAQVGQCILSIYGSFVRVVGASRLLAAKTEDEVEVDELRCLIAYRIEHAGRWLERLEDRVPRLSDEFAGAASHKAVRYLGVSGSSNVVVATKLVRATLVNIELVARGGSPRPFVDVCGDAPPVLYRDQILTKVPVLVPWVLRDLAPVPFHALFQDIVIELANARRSRAGSALLTRQVRRLYDSNGVLKKTPARLLIAIEDLNTNGRRGVAHKTVTTKAGFKPGASAQYLPVLVRDGLLLTDDEFGWVVTPSGLEQIARYKASAASP